MARVAAITAAAALTPIGLLTDEGFADRSARTGIAPIQRFDARGFPVQHAAEIVGRGDQVALAMAAARAALSDESAIEALRKAHSPSKIGVFFGAEPERIAVSDWAQVIAARRAAGPHEDPFATPILETDAYYRRSPARATDAIAEWVGARGPRRTLSMACVSSAAAIAAAKRAIVRGEISLALVGGAALNVEPLLFAGFCLLGAMSTAGACRPFDSRRDGFALADGAGLLVFEEESIARARGANIRGRILGGALSLDAHRMTDPEPTGKGAATAIRDALADAQVAPDQIALVKAHATGTRKNDEVEAQVIHSLVGARPPVLAIKGAIGHGIAASGAVELIAALAALRKKECAPTTGLDEIDPSLPPIALSGEVDPSRAVDGTIALCNTFGFGGINCALVLEVAG
jgi:3-oxoacyl-[acyl-carrier-protein] synthase II